MPTQWFRHRWDEDRGDEFADWGGSTWVYATDEAGVVERQVEIYDSDAVLVYDETHAKDAYGMLSDKKLDLSAPDVERITEEEFVALTGSLKPLNRS
jgi:hypothetical protein